MSGEEKVIYDRRRTDIMSNGLVANNASGVDENRVIAAAVHDIRIWWIGIGSAIAGAGIIFGVLYQLSVFSFGNRITVLEEKEQSVSQVTANFDKKLDALRDNVNSGFERVNATILNLVANGKVVAIPVQPSAPMTATTPAPAIPPASVAAAAPAKPAAKKSAKIVKREEPKSFWQTLTAP